LLFAHGDSSLFGLGKFGMPERLGMLYAVSLSISIDVLPDPEVSCSLTFPNPQEMLAAHPKM
jgi:hypothetical protein